MLHPAWPTAEGGKWFILHVHTTGGGNGYTLHDHTAGGGGDRPCRVLLLAVGCGNRRILHCPTAGGRGGIHPTHPYCWRWKVIHPARPYCWWGGGRGRDTPYTSKLLAVEIDTSCKSILLVVKSDTLWMTQHSKKWLQTGVKLRLVIFVSKVQPFYKQVTEQTRRGRGEGCHPSDLLCWLTVIWSGAQIDSVGGRSTTSCTSTVYC